MRRAVLGVMLALLIVCVPSRGVAQKPSGPQTLKNLLQGEKPDSTVKAEQAAVVDSDPQPVRPAGTYVRPKDGYKHPDLDKAWANYDVAVEKATATLRDAIGKHRIAARETGDLEKALKCKAVLEALESHGQLPADEKVLQKQIEAAKAAYKNAAADLKKAYETVVTKLLRDTSRDEKDAASVKTELSLLLSNGASVPGVSGTWAANNGVAVNIVQRGEVISWNDTNTDFTHRTECKWTGSEFVGVLVRTNRKTGCVTRLKVVLSVGSANEMHLRNSAMDNNCDLPLGFSETFVLKKR